MARERERKESQYKQMHIDQTPTITMCSINHGCFLFFFILPFFIAINAGKLDFILGYMPVRFLYTY
jgi:hypothetical protein